MGCPSCRVGWAWDGSVCRYCGYVRPLEAAAEPPASLERWKRRRVDCVRGRRLSFRVASDELAALDQAAGRLKVERSDLLRAACALITEWRLLG